MGEGPHEDALAEGPHEDALAEGPHEDALAEGPHEDALAEGPHEDALAEGPHEDALAEGPHEDALRTQAQHILAAITALDPLSELPRTGWLLRGVNPCESIAAHSFGVVTCTLLLVDALRAEGRTIDGEKALRMAVIHDAPEAAMGDIPKPVKTVALKSALAEVEEKLAAHLLTPSVFEDWKAFELGDSLEARIVKAADKIHMMAKALIYTHQGRGELDEFWSHEETFSDLGIDLVRAIFDELRAQHKETSYGPQRCQ